MCMAHKRQCAGCNAPISFVDRSKKEAPISAFGFVFCNDECVNRWRAQNGLPRLRLQTHNGDIHEV